MNDKIYTKKYDYFNQFVRDATCDLKCNGICYAYSKDQADEIQNRLKNKLKTKIEVRKNEFGYEIWIPRKYRKEI